MTARGLCVDRLSFNTVRSRGRGMVIEHEPS